MSRCSGWQRSRREKRVSRFPVRRSLTKARSARDQSGDEAPHSKGFALHERPKSTVRRSYTVLGLFIALLAAKPRQIARLQSPRWCPCCDSGIGRIDKTIKTIVACLLFGVTMMPVGAAPAFVTMPLGAVPARTSVVTMPAAGMSAHSGVVTMPAAEAPAQGSRSPSEILAVAARNGDRVASVLKEYTYYEELTIETVGPDDVTTGRYHRFAQIYHNREGLRQERVFENKSTLPGDAVINSNAVNALLQVYQFMITQQALTQYEFNYVGRERIDEIGAYVFDVSPSIKLPDPEKSRDRYLKGRVWIDDRDLQVVKVSGDEVPVQNSDRTPRFETYFQNLDEYWFPAYTSADDQMRMARRMTRVMVKVRFTGYKKENELPKR